MIASLVIDEIRELLAEGRLSYRAIAERAGVSRGLVTNVANGRRPDYDAIRRRRQENFEPIALGPLARCRTCGGLVHLPCRLCQLQEQLATSPPRSADPRSPEPLELELRGEARVRYEAIHQRRMEQGEPTDEDETAPAEEEFFLFDEDDEDWL
jgi:hypothetical protein